MGGWASSSLQLVASGAESERRNVFRNAQGGGENMVRIEGKTLSRISQTLVRNRVFANITCHAPTPIPKPSFFLTAIRIMIEGKV